MTPIERLLADLRPPEPLVELETADPRLEEAAAAAFSGNYPRAAQIGEALYSERIFDARLLGYVLFETLNERGPAALELVLRAAAQVLSEGRAAFTPVARRDVLLDGSLNWLLEKLVRQLERAEKLKDKEQSWQRWVTASKDGVLAGALPAAEALQSILGTLTPRARGLVPLLHLLDLLRQLAQSAEPQSQRSADARSRRNFSSAATLEAKLQEDATAAEGVDSEAGDGKPDGAAPRHESAERGAYGAGRPEEARAATNRAEVAPAWSEPKDSNGSAGQGPPAQPEDDPFEPEDDPFAVERNAPAEQEAEDVEAPEEPARPPSRPKARFMRLPKPRRPLPAGFVSETALAASLPLRKLARTIQRFVQLVEQEDFVAAAVVAAEVQGAIEHFDPRLYLPAVLTPYFTTLASSSDELEPILKQRDSLAFTALRQLYQVAPQSFSGGFSLAAHAARHSLRDDEEHEEAEQEQAEDVDTGEEDES